MGLIFFELKDEIIEIAELLFFEMNGIENALSSFSKSLNDACYIATASTMQNFCNFIALAAKIIETSIEFVDFWDWHEALLHRLMFVKCL